MNFEPQTEKAIDDELELADGVYDFEVISAEDTTSKAGNEMIAVVLRVFAADGSTRQVRDWLLPAPALSKKKLVRFCRSVGIEDKYENGTLTGEDCQGMAGRVAIKRKDNGQYGMQPTVETYEMSGSLPSKTPKPASAGQASAAEPAPEDCPF